MRIEWDVPIEMDDGNVLRADVYLPDEDGQYPVVLSHGVYGKGIAFQEAYEGLWNRLTTAFPEVMAGSSNRYQCWEVVDPEKWVPFGYAVVRVDSRGAGRSPGFASPLDPRETKDYYNSIEWAGTQPWSNGKVGTSGISYYAINQWQVAALKPPHLAAMIPWEGFSDFYRDCSRHGGMLSEFWPNWFERRFTPLQHGLGTRGRTNPNTGELACGPVTLTDEELAANRVDMRAMLKEHELDGEFYARYTPDLTAIEVPFLSAANWGGVGLHMRGNSEAFMRASSPQKWLEVHGLEHWTHYYTDYGVQLQREFFDHFLKGEDNGWDQRPPVLLNVRYVDGFVQRAEDEFPLARTVWTEARLDAADRSMTLGAPAPEQDASASFQALEDKVLFSTAPFAHETEITGPVVVKLFVSSSTTDADVFVNLHLFDPQGVEVTFQGAVDPQTPIGQGWLRASQRKLDPARSLPYRPFHAHDEAQPLIPGEVYELDLEIWVTCIVIPAGYRLALSVAGKDYEADGEGEVIPNFKNELKGSGPYIHIDPDDRPADVYGGTTTVHTGPARSAFVLLPVIPPKA
jgi:uncharacterized protein